MSGSRRLAAMLVVGLSSLMLLARSGAATTPADQERAEQLANAARRAEDQGDRREATRLLLRASRWDQSRYDDWRQAIAWAESFNPEAAVRNAAVLARLDPSFGMNHVALLKRLKAHAVESNAAEAAADAARLSRRLARWGSGQKGFPSSRVARFWLEAGLHNFADGDAIEASSALDRFQRLVISHPKQISSRAVGWDVIAGIHFAADKSDRALIAIGLLVDQEGETATAVALRAQAALAMGEPLLAIEHVEEMVRLIDEPIPSTFPPITPYAVLVDSLGEINQTDRILPTLRGLLAERPRDTQLRSRLIEQLIRFDRRAEALEIGRVLFEDFLAEPREETGVGYSGLLVEAFALWVAAAERSADVEPILNRLPALVDRLAGWRAIGPALDRLLEDPARRVRAEAWLDRSSGGETPEGYRRARFAMAVRLDRPDVAEAMTRSRTDHLISEDSDLDEIESGAYAMLEAMGRPSALWRWVIERLDSSGLGGKEATNRLIALLKIDLAESIATSAKRVAAGREAAFDEADRLLGEARGVSTDDDYWLFGEAVVATARSDKDRALNAARRLAERQAAGRRDGSLGPGAYRLAALPAAGMVEPDDSPSRVAQAVEVYELALDQNPDDAWALNELAYLWAQRGESLVRAERMARHAVDFEPGSPAYRDTLGWVLYQRGRTEEAVAVLEEAIELFGPDEDQDSAATIHQHHAAAMRALGRAEEAEAADAALLQSVDFP